MGDEVVVCATWPVVIHLYYMCGVLGILDV